jgi:hypothetical protein
MLTWIFGIIALVLYLIVGVFVSGIVGVANDEAPNQYVTIVFWLPMLVYNKTKQWMEKE